MFDLFFHKPATEFCKALDNEDDQDEVRRLLGILRQDPFWDNITKVEIPVLSDDGDLLGTTSVYVSPRFTIAYHVYGNDLIHIRGIERTVFVDDDDDA